MERITRLGLVAALGAAALSAHAQISGFGGAYTLNSNGDGPAVIEDSNTLQLADQNDSFQANSVYYNTQQNIDAFTASFTYTVTGYNAGDGFSPADGFTFVMQNDQVNGLNALGIAGRDLGYSNTQDQTQEGVQNSVAVAFNLYSGTGPGPGEDLATDANNSFNYNDVSPISLFSGDPINVVLTYSNDTLVESLVDAANPSLTYTNSYNIDIAGTVGSDNAWIGFTAANANGSATQVITNFEFTPAPEPCTMLVLGGGAISVFAKRRKLRA